MIQVMAQEKLKLILYANGRRIIGLSITSTVLKAQICLQLRTVGCFQSSMFEKYLIRMTQLQKN